MLKIYPSMEIGMVYDIGFTTFSWPLGALLAAKETPRSTARAWHFIQVWRTPALINGLDEILHILSYLIIKNIKN